MESFSIFFSAIVQFNSLHVWLHGFRELFPHPQINANAINIRSEESSFLIVCEYIYKYNMCVRAR